MIGICKRCMSTGVNIKLIDGITLCKGCERNFKDEKLGV